MPTILPIIYIARLSAILLFLLLFSDCAVDSAANREEKLKATENMGISLVRQGKLRAGLEYLLEAVEKDPNNPDLHHELARVYYDLGEYQLSLIQFKKALHLRPKFSEALNNLGVLYVQMNEWDLALECFQGALDNILYKTPYYALRNIGSVYFHRGEYQKAIDEYKKALSLAPNYIDAYYDLASAYEAMNRIEEAVSALERATSLDPEFWKARFNLGRLYLELGRREEARKELNAVIESDPRDHLAMEARRLLQENK